MKRFIQIKNLIISVDLIKSIRPHGQTILVECTDETYHVHFSSESSAIEECDRIFSVLTFLTL